MLSQIKFRDFFQNVLPGMVIVLFFYLLSGINFGIEISLIAIITGFLASPMLGAIWHNYYFEHIMIETKAREVFVMLFNNKIKNICHGRPQCKGHDESFPVCCAHYASIYNDKQLESFRNERAYGIMFSSISIILLAGGIFSFILYIISFSCKINWSQLLIAICAFVLSYQSLINGARIRFEHSLLLEHQYWSGMFNEKFKEVIENYDTGTNNGLYYHRLSDNKTDEYCAENIIPEPKREEVNLKTLIKEYFNFILLRYYFNYRKKQDKMTKE